MLSPRYGCQSTVTTAVQRLHVQQYGTVSTCMKEEPVQGVHHHCLHTVRATQDGKCLQNVRKGSRQCCKRRQIYSGKTHERHNSSHGVLVFWPTCSYCTKVLLFLNVLTLPSYSLKHCRHSCLTLQVIEASVLTVLERTPNGIRDLCSSIAQSPWLVFLDRKIIIKFALNEI